MNTNADVEDDNIIVMWDLFEDEAHPEDVDIVMMVGGYNVQHQSSIQIKMLLWTLWEWVDVWCENTCGSSCLDWRLTVKVLCEMMVALLPVSNSIVFLLFQCNAKAKVLCGRMDIRPSTGLFGCEQENKPPHLPPSFLSSSASRPLSPLDWLWRICFPLIISGTLCC